MDSVQKGDFESAKAMLADDFQFSCPVPEPINKEAWLGMNARKPFLSRLKRQG
jgi:hypothetical protein